MKPHFILMAEYNAWALATLSAERRQQDERMLGYVDGLSDALLERDSVIEDLRIERTLVHGTMMKT
jgi:hypothetical protein